MYETRLVTGHINVDVAYKKVSAATLVPRPVVIYRDTKGNRIYQARKLKTGEIAYWSKAAAAEQGEEEGESGYHNIFATKEGEEVKKEDVRFFKLLETGKEQPFTPFSRSAEVKVIKEVNISAKDTFLVETTYELFAKIDKKSAKAEGNVVAALYQEAERYLREDIMGIGLFSWGGLKQMYSVVYPIMNAKQFVWLVKFVQTKLEYQHLMDIPTAVVAAEKPPTLSELPPIEALV